MKRTLRAAAGAGLTLATLLVAPAPASAGSDVKVHTLPVMQYPKWGPPKAQLQNVRVTWRRDRADRRVWVTVSGRLRDSGPGDGYCARFGLHTSINSWKIEETSTRECDGVWRSASLALEPGSGGMVFLDLYTKPGADRTSTPLRDPWRTDHHPY